MAIKALWLPAEYVMTTVKTILSIPFCLLSVFTRAKNFSRNPIIGNKALNRLGLHRFRLWLAGHIGRWRCFWLRGGVAKNIRDSYQRDGYVAVENMLSAGDIDAIKQELAQCSGGARRMIQGDCWTERVLLTRKRLKEFPTVKAFLRRPDVKALIAYTATKSHMPLFYIQRIKHLPDRPLDPQKTMHSDTFQPTMKAWIFLEDVSENQGPFSYVPGSHRYTKARADYETEIALSHENLSEYHSGRGSIRAKEDAIQRMGLPPKKGLTAKAGTMIAANTNGYHGRGGADPGASRLEIFIYSRTTPFMPLPFGLWDPLWLGAFGLDLWHQYREWKTAKKGAYPIWRSISVSDMIDPDFADKQAKEHHG